MDYQSQNENFEFFTQSNFYINYSNIIELIYDNKLALYKYICEYN